jgi:ABC-type spermidine/putrescine transport system permease subunit I
MLASPTKIASTADRRVKTAVTVRRPRSLAIWKGLIFLPGATIILSLVVACLILLRFSFNTWDPVRTMVPDWSLRNYAALATDPVVARAFITTLRISVIVTVVCLVIGYPVAYAISRSRHRALLTFLIVTPMLMDVLIRAYGWIIMLGQYGIVNVLMTGLGIWPRPQRLIFTELSVILELIHELIPFMVLPIANVLERINRSYAEAAMNLRAGPVRTFLHITLPLSMPGIAAGTLLTFALAMSAFVAPLVLGGGNVMTMTMLMRQSMFTTLNWPLGAAQSIALVAIVLALLAVYRRQLSRASGGAP